MRCRGVTVRIPVGVRVERLLVRRIRVDLGRVVVAVVIGPGVGTELRLARVDRRVRVDAVVIVRDIPAEAEQADSVTAASP